MLGRSSKTWRDTMTFKPKLRTYTKFKQTYELEEYVTGYMPRHQRSILAQFRAGILPLHLETGRWQNTPVEHRVCQVCTSNNIEDECHFLCVCDAYDSPRQLLFRAVSQRNSEFENMQVQEKLVYLLKFAGRETAKYLETAFNIRKSLLYS